MLNKILAILLVVMVWFNAWLVLNPPPKPPPEIKYITQYATIEKPVYVPVDKPVYIDKPVYVDVEKPVYVEKVIEQITYRNIFDRQWESVGQFTAWYLTQGFTLLFPYEAYPMDCDDYAEWVSRQALEQGYQVSIALTWQGMYYGKKVTDIFTQQVSGHTGSLVEIQGTFYYFEPRIDEFKGLIKIAPRD